MMIVISKMSSIGAKMKEVILDLSLNHASDVWLVTIYIFSSPSNYHYHVKYELTYQWIVHEVATGCWSHRQPTWLPSPVGLCHGSEAHNWSVHPSLYHGGQPTLLKYCWITHFLIAIGTGDNLDSVSQVMKRRNNEFYDTFLRKVRVNVC